MQLVPFLLERIMSEWQNKVEVDLTQSGVQAMRLAELISLEELQELHSRLELRFVQTNGPAPLRAAVTKFYPGSELENVLITNGSSEALMVTLWKLCEPGTRIVQLSPTYPLVDGLARSFGADVISVQLEPASGWKLDLDALAHAVTPDTDVVYICNPNNPTGSFLTEAEIEMIVEIAGHADAWVIADEIYRGGELAGETPSFWGRYDKLLVTSSLSKVYRLAGLRIGWVAGPQDQIAEIWPYHDYTTTTTGAINAELARLAFERRDEIVARTRAIAQKRLPVLEAWVSDHPDWFTYTPTRLAGHAFVGYRFEIGSVELAEHLIDRCGVLIAPGSLFGLDKYFRIGYGLPHLEEGLHRLTAAFAEYEARAA
jgi:aspartate/methionine/tyrosine aminotransferase